MKGFMSFNDGLSVQGEVEVSPWLEFLPKWSLTLALATLSLPIVLVVAVGQESGDTVHGLAYIELLQAVRSPVLFRIGWIIDALIWLLIGGSLIILGILLRRRNPVISMFIQISGLAQLIGFLGTLIRLSGTLDLAGTYIVAPVNEQIVILHGYDILWRVIEPHLQVPLLFSGIGYALAAYGYFAVKGFPKWLAIWLLVPGLLGLTQFVIIVSGLPKLNILNYLGVVLGNIALNAAIAIALWHPSKELFFALSANERGIGSGT
jgi:hypothetical protein